MVNTAIFCTRVIIIAEADHAAIPAAERSKPENGDAANGDAAMDGGGTGQVPKSCKPYLLKTSACSSE